MYLAQRLRPNALIVAGGIEAQFNYQTLLDKSPCRIVISGEGEVPMKMLKKGTVVHLKQREHYTLFNVLK